MNEDQGMVKAAYDGPQEDSRREIERLLMQLNDSVSSMDHMVQMVIEKTSPVAAMERSVPDVGNDIKQDRMPETQIGNNLYDSISRLNLLNDRLNEHCYKLEI